jgi:class 3 adenylate cyclase/HEAT repeat protein
VAKNKITVKGLRESLDECFSRDELYQHLLEQLDSFLAGECILCFEEEQLISELRLVCSSDTSLNPSRRQRFVQMGGHLHQYLSRGPLEVSALESGAFSDLGSFFTIPFSLGGRSGLWVIINPSLSLEELTLHSLELCREAVPVGERINLREKVEEYQLEQELQSLYSEGGEVGSSSSMMKILSKLESLIKCQVIVLLTKDESTGEYSLESGNAEGCEFWGNQETYLREIAQNCEYLGVLCRSYSGRFFTGEKYGLDRLETLLAVPMQFGDKNLGVWVFLNKRDQRCFNKTDVRMARAASQGVLPALLRARDRAGMVRKFRQLLSDRVVREIMEDESAWAHPRERKNVAVLFVDLNGFTALTERQQPTDLLVQLNEFFAAMTRQVERFGGGVDKFIGDNVMAVFSGSEDGSLLELNALECACAMHEEMEKLARKWQLEGKEPLTASIGLNCGRVVMGPVGCDTHVDLTVVGQTVNVASRLTEYAGDGEILAGESVIRVCKPLLEVEVIPDAELKGVQHPVDLFKIIGFRSPEKLLSDFKAASAAYRCRFLSLLSGSRMLASESFVELGLAESDLSVRLSALSTILRQNMTEFAPKIIESIGNSNSNDVRSYALDVMMGLHWDILNSLLQDFFHFVPAEERKKFIDSVMAREDCDNRKMLLSLLSDSSQLVRANVAHALYRHGDRTMMEILKEMLFSSQQDLKMAAIPVLSRIGTAESVAPLLQALAQGVRGVAGYEISAGLFRQRHETILKFIWFYMQELGYSGDWLALWDAFVSGKEPEMRLLASEEPLVVYSAVKLMSNDVLFSDFSTVFSVLQSTEENEIQVLLLLRLKGHLDQSQAASLKKLLSFNLSARARSILLEILMKNRVSGWYELLLSEIQSEDFSLVMNGVLCLAASGETGCLPELLHVYETSDNANVKATVIRALGGFEPDKVRSLLLASLDSPIGRIRANAIESLMEIGERDFLHDVEPLLKDPNNRVRANLALAMFQAGMPQASSVLEEMLDSHDKWMRLSAVWAVKTLSTEIQYSLILPVLKDVDYDVRLRAMAILAGLGKDLSILLENL